MLLKILKTAIKNKDKIEDTAGGLAELAKKAAQKAKVPYKQNYPSETEIIKKNTKLIYTPPAERSILGRQYGIPNTPGVGIVQVNKMDGVDKYKYLVAVPDPKTGQGVVAGELDLVHGPGKGGIKKLINIEIKPEFRNLGLGTKIVQGLKYYGSDKQGLEIRDIKRTALKWWRKQGLVDERMNVRRNIKRPDGYLRNPDTIVKKKQGGSIENFLRSLT
tara:strand:- start:7 stop:660 length:654 start_codon:yes stop_codon:yes gene_type:complete